MKYFAPVCPPQLYHKLRSFGDFVVGDYHLLLAHDVAARPGEYANAIPASSFVIMDNSLIELGKPCDSDTMAKACLDSRPWRVRCAVLPDYPHDGKKTIESSVRAAKEWAGIVPTYMAVPQGKTLEDYVSCAKLLAMITPVQYWGIPRSVQTQLGTRWNLIRALTDAEIVVGRFIHLLGFSSNLEDDILCTKHPFVMGIDSAVPTRMGQNTRLMYRGQSDPGPRRDYWERSHAAIWPHTIANLSLIRGWINEDSGGC